MNTENQPLPEKLEPFRQQIVTLRKQHIKLGQDLRENEAKLQDAIKERDALSQSDPNTASNVTKLAEAHVRVQLFANHGEKLKSAGAEVDRQAKGVTEQFSRELQRIGAEAEAFGRQKFITAVSRLVVDPPNAVAIALKGPYCSLTSSEEKLGQILAIGARHEDDDDPFDRFDALVDYLNEFVAGWRKCECRTDQVLA